MKQEIYYHLRQGELIRELVSLPFWKWKRFNELDKEFNELHEKIMRTK